MPRILLITDTPPWPPNTGGHQRSNLLYRALAACGHVDLLLLSKYPSVCTQESLARMRTHFRLLRYFDVPPHRDGTWGMLWSATPPPARRYVRALVPPRSAYLPAPAVASWLARRTRSCAYDLFVGRYLRPTARSGALTLTPSIVDVDDLDTDAYETRLRESNESARSRYVLRRSWKALKQLMPQLLDRCTHLFVTNETDRFRVGTDRSTVLPNIPYVPADKQQIDPLPASIESQNILVVGALNYGPNARGLDRFLVNVWPYVRQACPLAHLRIVGGGVKPDARRRWAAIPGVDLVGFLAGLRDEYRDCAFTVAPVYEGAGTKIKVLESLAHGRTCVVTPHAHRGYERILRDGESLALGSDDRSMAEACVTLLRDAPYRDRLARRGCQLVRTHFTLARFCRIVEETVVRVLGQRRV